MSDDLEKVARQLYLEDESDASFVYNCDAMFEEWRKYRWEHAPPEMKKAFMQRAAGTTNEGEDAEEESPAGGAPSSTL